MTKKWFKDQNRADYRAFYPGPPSNPADSFGRYLGSIVTGSNAALIDYLAKFWNDSFNSSWDLRDWLRNNGFFRYCRCIDGQLQLDMETIWHRFKLQMVFN